VDSTAQAMRAQFVGDCDHDFVERRTLSGSVHPLPEASGVVSDANRTGTVDQHPLADKLET